MIFLKTFTDSHSQQVTAVTEETDTTLSDGKLLKQSHVVYQQIEQSDLVHEAHGNVEAIWVYGDTVDLLLKPLGKFQTE